MAGPMTRDRPTTSLYSQAPPALQREGMTLMYDCDKLLRHGKGVRTPSLCLEERESVLG